MFWTLDSIVARIAGIQSPLNFVLNKIFIFNCHSEINVSYFERIISHHFLVDFPCIDMYLVSSVFRFKSSSLLVEIKIL
jgi:hypothetical protein